MQPGPQPAVMQQPQQIPVTVAYTTSSEWRPNYAGRCARILGVIQLMCGILSIVLQVISIVVLAGFYFVGHGIWAGIFVSCNSAQEARIHFVLFFSCV